MPAFASRDRRPSLPALHLGACTVAVVVIGLLAIGVYVGAGFVHLDAAFVRVLRDNGTDGLTAMAHGVSRLGDTEVVLSLTLVATLGALSTRHWHAALAIPASVLATQGVVHGIKLMVERARPPRPDAVVDAAGYAFPSAHAASGMALYGLLAVVAATYLRGRVHAWVCILIGALVLAIGGTRVYLGAHYPTDVLAGWLVGGLVAYAAWRLAAVVRPPRTA